MGVTNYARFYQLLAKMSYDGDKEELKEQLVWQYSLERTTHLHELNAQEYRNMCTAMEILTGERQKLRRLRSQVLKQMQRMGVMTNDWQRVNDLCMNARIAGKAFARLSTEELEALKRKLYAIERNGGLRPTPPSPVGREQAAADSAAIPITTTATKYEC